MTLIRCQKLDWLSWGGRWGFALPSAVCSHKHLSCKLAESSSLFPSDTSEDSAKNPPAKYGGTGSLIGLQFKLSFVKTRSFLERARGRAVGMWDESRRVGAARSRELSWLLSSSLSFCLVPFQNEDMGDATPAEELEPSAARCPLFDPSMRSEARRLRTFWQWPHTAPVSARDLAKAGFFFVGPRDQVQCFCCGGVLMDWGPGDCPLAEHLKFFSSCKFIRGEDAGNQEMFPLQEIFDTVDGQFLSLLQGIDSEEAAPQNPEMVTEEMRLMTFRNWPQYIDVHPEQLARAGFFYTGRYSMEMFLTLIQVNIWRHDDVLFHVQILASMCRVFRNHVLPSAPAASPAACAEFTSMLPPVWILRGPQ